MLGLSWAEYTDKIYEYVTANGVVLLDKLITSFEWDVFVVWWNLWYLSSCASVTWNDWRCPRKCKHIYIYTYIYEDMKIFVEASHRAMQKISVVRNRWLRYISPLQTNAETEQCIKFDAYRLQTVFTYRIYRHVHFWFQIHKRQSIHLQ